MRQLLVLIILIMSLSVQAQQNRFVFLQSQPGEPFYVRMGDKTLSSTSFGYLVIAPLKDSVYHLHIGLPKNQAPEQEFLLEIKGTDRGFELKKSTENGFRLYEWQNMQFLDPVSRELKAPEQANSLKTDAYSKLMAGVVDDPAVAMTMVIKSTPAPASKMDNVPAQSKANAAPVVAEVSSPPEIPSMDGSVKAFASNEPLYKVKDSGRAEASLYKVSDSVSNDLSRGKLVNDSTNIKKDSVLDIGSTANIRVDSAGTAVSPGNGLTDKNPGSDSSISGKTVQDFSRATSSLENGPPKATIRKLAEDNVAGARKLVFTDSAFDKSDTVELFILAEEPAPGYQSGSVEAGIDSAGKRDTGNLRKDSALKGPMQNSDCVKFASDAEVDRLRVLMLKESNDDDRIFQARKAFRTRCFTTRQVRGLSELFPSDEGRYRFLDAAYPFVSDFGNFRSLLELLTDPYYINRFKAMVRLQD